MARLHLGECSLGNQLYYISRLLSVIGINIFDCKWMTGLNKIRDILLMSLSFLLLVYLLVGYMSATLNNFEVNIVEFLSSVTIMSGLFTEFLQLCWIVYFRNDLVQFINLAKSEVQRQKSEDERKAYSDSMRFSKLISIATIAFNLLTHLNIIFHLPFDRQSGFRARIFVPIGLEPLNKSPNFEFFLAISIMSSTFFFFARSGYAMIYITLLGHCSSQYRVLGKRVDNIVQSISDKGNVRNESITDEMKFAIDSHCIIISMTSKLQHIYEFIVASDVLTLQASRLAVNPQFDCDIAVAGPEGLMVMGTVVTALLLRETFLISILGSQLFCFVVFSFISEVLNTEREHFSNSIYLTDWYLVCVPYRKYISYIRLLASKPLTLTIARLMVLSLETLLFCLKFTYSLYALVKSKSV